MKINLKAIYVNNPEWFSERSRLKAVLADLYPECRREVNILLNVYDSGIVDEILSCKSIDNILLNRFTELLDGEYGIKKEFAVEAILTWAEVYEATIETQNMNAEDVITNEEQYTETVYDSPYMKQAKFYNQIIGLEEYLKESPDDEKALYEFISMVYDTLVEPEYVFAKGEAEYIARQCINSIDKLKEKEDVDSRYRFLRVKFAQASCFMIVGELGRAYDIFSSIVKPMDKLAEELHGGGALGDMLFRCEANIHQIKELCGINDRGFFVKCRQEIIFFESHVPQLNFTFDGGYCLPTLIPLARDYRNAFYCNKDITAFGYGGQFFGINKAQMDSDGNFSIQYNPINLYSGVSIQRYMEWIWNTQTKKIDISMLREHIQNHPHIKEDGYITMLITRNNKRNGRS